MTHLTTYTEKVLLEAMHCMASLGSSPPKPILARPFVKKYLISFYFPLLFVHTSLPEICCVWFVFWHFLLPSLKGVWKLLDGHFLFLKVPVYIRKQYKYEVRKCAMKWCIHTWFVDTMLFHFVKLLNYSIVIQKFIKGAFCDPCTTSVF